MSGGGTIGFYDGFFGPGTGSFFVFAFARGVFLIVVAALIAKTTWDAYGALP